ncbi:DUF7287 family protein [Halorhabdus amylolytica]|uniref:DUF7287 family protein n=1 Tax=Halorhabdus amylolytica TaxID=2559573 RepID=UPI0010AA0AE3|nr:hypothetical protein [Halorhabdus amylolytica]
MQDSATRTEGRRAGDDRGQTLQDFVLGISIFIVGFFIVLSMFPGLLGPFQSGLSSDKQANAERISATIVSNLSEPAQPNHLNTTATKNLFALSASDVRTRFNLSRPTQVNVTLEALNGSAQLEHVGDVVTRNQTATSIRIVHVNVTSGDCDPACRLVVRTW